MSARSVEVRAAPSINPKAAAAGGLLIWSCHYFQKKRGNFFKWWVWGAQMMDGALFQLPLKFDEKWKKLLA
jgi:hypothetical protein